MQEELAVTAPHCPARFGDEPKCVPALPRPLPPSTGKRTVPGKDQVERDIARRGTGIQRIVNGQQLDEASAKVVRRRRRWIGPRSITARYPLIAGGGGEARRGKRITQNDQTISVSSRCEAETQPNTGVAEREDQVAFRGSARFGEQVKAGWNNNRRAEVGGFDEDNVGCGAG